MKREVANKLSSERRAELRADAELQSNTSLRLRTMLKVSSNNFFHSLIAVFLSALTFLLA